MQPTFSVIIPTYNRSEFIQRTIESVLGSENPDFELLVVDDGSTDNTAEVIGKIKDPRLIYIHQNNQERGKARNTGIAHSRGRYITFLDSDDIFYPSHLSAPLAHLASSSPFIWSPYDIVDESEHLLQSILPNDKRPLERMIQDGNFLSCHGVFIRRDIAEQFQFREDRSLSGSEDMELWIRLLVRFPLTQLEKCTSALVHHSGRSVLNFPPERLIERKSLMLDYLRSDEVTVNKLGADFRILEARAWSYVALHLSMNSQSTASSALKYLIKSISHYPRTIFSIRTLIIIRELFKRSLLRPL